MVGDVALAVAEAAPARPVLRWQGGASTHAATSPEARMTPTPALPVPQVLQVPQLPAGPAGAAGTVVTGSGRER